MRFDLTHCAPAACLSKGAYLSSFWHFWLATVHEVLQADWHDAWHSPHPVPALALMQGFCTVVMCFMLISSMIVIRSLLYNTY